MKSWLDCTISRGQFSNEVAVTGVLFDDTVFSLFAPKDDVQFEGVPSNGDTVPGRISVNVLSEEGELLLVELPQPTFENGRMITVNASKVKQHSP